MSTKFEELTRRALDAFWEFVATQYPNSSTGDLSPLVSFHLTKAAKSAVKEWVRANVPKHRRKTAEHVTPTDLMHTPGPWLVDQTLPQSPLCIKPHHGSNICDIERSNRESKANATLIAAAPELLIACQIAVKDIRWLESYCRWNDSTIHPHLKAIEAAIAKATSTESISSHMAA